MELNTTFMVFIWIFMTMVNCVMSSTFSHLPRRLLPPRFHSTPTNVTYEKGSLAILYCSIDNLGTKTVTWRKHPYNVPITVGREQFVKINRFYLSANNVQWNLLIKNVQTFDAGTYECQISSTTKILRRNITLNVIENGRSFKQEIEITGTRVVEKGESIFLMCNASGMTSPPDGIDWFKDGNLLTTRQWDDTRIEKQISYSANVIVSTLTIRNTQMSDTGTYVCRTSELLTDTFQVNVLNAETYNVKREYEELSHGDDSQYGGLYYGRSKCSYISSKSLITILIYNVFIHSCLYIVNR